MKFSEKINKMWGKIICADVVRVAPEHHAALKEVLSMMRPYQAVGIKKKRIGVSRDGGYVMLDDFALVKEAFSLGIGHDVSWDLDLARRGIPVQQYDFSIEKPPRDHPLFTFHQVRIGLKHDAAAGLQSLAALTQKHSSVETNLILKMDIEGAEWEVLSQTPPEALLPFRQIVIELHHFSQVAHESWLERARQSLSHLLRYHLPVHVHGNCIAPLIISQDIKVPDTLELTLARRDTYQLVPTDETFPGPYDKSNSLILPEVKLGKFQFF